MKCCMNYTFPSSHLLSCLTCVPWVYFVPSHLVSLPSLNTAASAVPWPLHGHSLGPPSFEEGEGLRKHGIHRIAEAA